MKDVEGKVALVSGASSGIGKAVCEKLAREKVDLALLARREEKLDELSERFEQDFSVDTLVLPTDVRDDEQVDKAVEKTLDKFGRLDIVVNNAGIIRYGHIEDFSTEDYKAVMETNCDGMFYLTRASIPHLRDSLGNLIFVGSFDSNHPRSFNPIYAASKWWTKAFAHSVESIVGEDGVAVTMINPSEVRTNIQSEEGKKYKEKFEMGEMIEPEEIAEAVLFSVKRSSTSTVSEMNLYRRDKMSDFF